MIPWDNIGRCKPSFGNFLSSLVILGFFPLRSLTLRAALIKSRSLRFSGIHPGEIESEQPSANTIYGKIKIHKIRLQLGQQKS
jgi:hypothetical protein